MSASESRADPPSDRVLEAFGRHGRPQPLSDDRHATWRVGDLVLKPADISYEQLEWQASLQRRLRDHDGFRMPQAARSLDGRLLVDGWYAMTFLEGRHEPARWPDIIAVGAVFHDAVADEQVPSFLEQRRDPWSIGDRVAWGAEASDDLPETKHLDRLLATLAGLDARSQLIHGDLTGNVLFDDRLPPAILDLSPYHRPRDFASAIVVADALVWEGADETLVRAFRADRDFPQYLVRALIYRIVTDRLFRRNGPLRADADDPYARPVDLVVALAGG